MFERKIKKFDDQLNETKFDEKTSTIDREKRKKKRKNDHNDVMKNENDEKSIQNERTITFHRKRNHVKKSRLLKRKKRE